MQRQYNLRNPAVKRLMKEAQELHEPTEQYHAQPLEDNLFEWHFTIRGPADSEFENGLYHGRIILPPEYPMKPPSIILLTPNGRFDINKKICLSISGYHPESWQPSWSIRTALLAIIGFMPTHGTGAIGALDYSPQERKTLAKRSQGWKCSSCGELSNVLLEVTEASQETNKKAKELASQISFQAEKEKRTSLPGTTTSDAPVSSGQPDTAAPPVEPVDAAPSEISPNIPLTSAAPLGISPNIPVTIAAQMPSMPASHLPPLSPFSPAFNVPMWQPPTNSGDSKFGPTFPLPFVSPFTPGFPPQYFMPGNHPFYNPGLAPTPNIPFNPASDDSHLAPSGPTQPTSPANSSQKESTAPALTTETKAQSSTTETKAQSSTTESKAQSTTTESKAQSTTTQSKAQSTTTESKAQSTTTESKAQSTTTESKTQSPTTEGKFQSLTKEPKAQSPSTDSKAQSLTTETTEQSLTTESTAQSPTSGSTTYQSATITSEMPTSRVHQRNTQRRLAGSAVPVSSLRPQTRENQDYSLILVLLLLMAIILLFVRRLLMVCD